MTFEAAFAVQFYVVMELLAIVLGLFLGTFIIDWWERRTYSAPPINPKR